MKRIFALFCLILVTLSLLFTLSSCESVEDIKGIKVSSVNLEFNFYEVTTYQKRADLESIGAPAYVTGVVVGQKEGDKAVIVYCKTEALVTMVRPQLEKRLADMGEGYFVDVTGSTLFLGTEDGLAAATKQNYVNRLYHTFIEDRNYMYIVEGLGNTMIITLGALLIGVVLGVLVAVLKYYSEGNPKLKVINVICDVYTTVIRGIPITVLLLIFFFVILVSADGILVAIIAFGINSGAYMAELVRSGINAVDGGQMEAARSLGMSKWQAMRTIIFPQAIKNVLPAIGNECIALLKETSVAGYVAVVDLTRGANLIRNNTYDAFNPLILSAIIYLVLVIGMTQLLRILERRLAKSERRIRK
jgi:His/Glu/Gln/Arg/opine family amino acid ABC transporter permease subunit